MNHTTLKTTLASLCLVISASNPSWSAGPASGPAPGQYSQIPGPYPAPPVQGHRTGRVPLGDWYTGHRYYPAPWSSPPQGRPRPAFTPREQPRDPAADSPDAMQIRLLAELDICREERDAAGDELRQSRALLEDAGQALDQAYKDYAQVTAGYEALDTQLATAVDERDGIRERETELSIELMATQRQLAQASERTAQLEKEALEHARQRSERERREAEREAQLAESSERLAQLQQEAREHAREGAERERRLREREAQLAVLSERLAQLQQEAREHAREAAERERRLADSEAQLTELKALVASRTAEASGARSELGTLKQRLALMNTEVQAAADALTQAQSETAMARTQRDEQATRQQACQAERKTLATTLEQERRAHATRQKTLEQMESAHAALEAKLKACNRRLDAAGAELKNAQAQLEMLAAPPAAAAEAPPAVTDSDADGVADSDDLCPDTPPGGSVEATGCAAQAAVILEGVSFRYNSHELNAESHAILNRVAAILRRQPSLRLEIAGHTDNQGNPAYNQWLSQQRATSVRDYLVKQGVDPDTLTARGYGAQKPLADNTTREGLARNRRVELRPLP